MINTYWDAGSPLYKRVVITSMALSGLGIVLALIGANVGNRGLMYTAVGIIFAGLLTHMVGVVVRTRDMKAHRKQNPPQGRQPGPK